MIITAIESEWYVTDMNEDKYVLIGNEDAGRWWVLLVDF